LPIPDAAKEKGAFFENAQGLITTVSRVKFVMTLLARSGAAKPPPLFYIFFATPLPAPVTGQTLGFYIYY